MWASSWFVLSCNAIGGYCSLYMWASMQLVCSVLQCIVDSCSLWPSVGLFCLVVYRRLLQSVVYSRLLQSVAYSRLLQSVVYSRLLQSVVFSWFVLSQCSGGFRNRERGVQPLATREYAKLTQKCLSCHAHFRSRECPNRGNIWSSGGVSYQPEHSRCKGTAWAHDGSEQPRSQAPPIFPSLAVRKCRSHQSKSSILGNQQ